MFSVQESMDNLCFRPFLDFKEHLLSTLMHPGPDLYLLFLSHLSNAETHIKVSAKKIGALCEIIKKPGMSVVGVQPMEVLEQ